MEAAGDAFTLMVAEDIRHVNAIERFISQKIPRVKLENFDYRYTALFEEGKPGQPQGGGGRVRGARAGGFYGRRAEALTPSRAVAGRPAGITTQPGSPRCPPANRACPEFQY